MDGLAVREKDIKKLREAGYLAKKSSIISRPRDRSSLLRNPTRGLYFSLILSAG